MGFKWECVVLCMPVLVRVCLYSLVIYTLAWLEVSGN